MSLVEYQRTEVRIMCFWKKGAILSMLIVLLPGIVPAQTGNDAILPQLAVGADFTSYLTIGNPTGIESRKIHVQIYANNGTGLPVSVNGSLPVTETLVNLGSFEEVSLVLTKAGDLTAGWVYVWAEDLSRINVALRYVLGNQANPVQDSVGIIPAEWAHTWTIEVDKRAPTDYIGIALANPSDLPIEEITFDLFHGAQRVAGTETVTKSLPAAGHEAFFVHQLFPPPFDLPNGVYTLRMSSLARFSAVALRMDGIPIQFSSLPADQEAQLWNWSCTDCVSPLSGQWSWRFLDGHSFIGSGLSTAAANPFIVRGLLNETRFILDWSTSWSDAMGITVFQGVPGNEDGTDVINGTVTEVTDSGTVRKTYSFKATRVY
jgi:hypothetical protein